MHKMMKYEDEVNPANKTISSPIHKMSVLYDAMPMEWLPTGAEKCLKFLQAAVYVNGNPLSSSFCLCHVLPMLHVREKVMLIYQITMELYYNFENFQVLSESA